MEFPFLFHVAAVLSRAYMIPVAEMQKVSWEGARSLDGA